MHDFLSEIIDDRYRLERFWGAGAIVVVHAATHWRPIERRLEPQ